MDQSATPSYVSPHLRDSVALLRDRNFAYLFVAYLVAFFGGSMVPIAMAFGVLQLTGSTSDTGLVIASQIGGNALRGAVRWRGRGSRARAGA